jgi:nucleoside-diphosphate-sugar epimerase
MSRVLVTGGVGAIGTAVVKRLLADPAYEVRVADQRAAPQWMREGCEVHTGDLRVPREARAAMHGCDHVIQLASVGSGDASSHGLAHTLTEANNALLNTIVRAALNVDMERFVYVSSASVFERAELYPTPEDYLPGCPTPLSAYGFSKLTGEMYCRAAHEEHGLAYTICRACDAYGPAVAADAGTGSAHVAAEPNLVAELIQQVRAGRVPLEVHGSGEQTRTPTHVEDIAAGVLAAMSSPAGLNEDFNIAAARELTVAEIARIAWEACGEDPQTLRLEYLPATLEVQRRWPAAQKAKSVLGWEARIELEDGIIAGAR